MLKYTYVVQIHFLRMIERTPWTEQRFNFDFPSGKFPSIVERLRGTPARLEAMINTMPFMILNQPCNNGWCIQEHAGHLIDIEELHNNRLDEYEQGVKELSPADMSNLKTYNEVYAEKYIYNIVKDFARRRKQLVKRIEEYDEEMITRTAHHPRLDIPMRLIDMLYFIAEHDDHHLAIISDINRKLS